MNEQIRTILAEDGTKTSKIRKLLLLGLTHREIADLVTRGNRGFVWNVYKRMRDEGLIVSAGTPTATTTPELDYSFRRKFGVEIEAYNLHMPAARTRADGSGNRGGLGKIQP